MCDLHNIEVIKDLLEGAKAIGKKYKAYLFRMDPYVLESDDFFIAEMRKLGFRFKPGAGDNEPTQSRKNYMKDIENMTADEVFSTFHSKWRYNIRLAQRKGVVRSVCDKSHLDDFCALMKVTGERDGFQIRTKEYFAQMLDAFGPDHCRLYMCYYGDQPLSGAIATQYSGKTCYVYGASGNENRNLMPNYLMQWTMMQWAIENGCFLYDFQGIPFYEVKPIPTTASIASKRASTVRWSSSPASSTISSPSRPTALSTSRCIRPAGCSRRGPSSAPSSRASAGSAKKPDAYSSKIRVKMGRMPIRPQEAKKVLICGPMRHRPSIICCCRFDHADIRDRLFCRMRQRIQQKNAR